MKDRIIKDILKEYDNLRLREKEALIQKENEVFDKIPEMEELQNKLIELMGAASRNVINNPQDMDSTIPYLKEKVKALRKRKGATDRAWFPC